MHGLGPLLLATTNAKKIGEMQRLLQPLGFKLASVAPGQLLDVAETGDTFAANAALKAIAQAKHFGLSAIGEDSGLVVPALGGEPGIFSARYAGRKSEDPHENDCANNALLLERMASLKGSDRIGYYVSSIALADSTGNVLLAVEDRCYGRLLETARGNNGFGYDPLFEIVELHCTFAELTTSVKSAISHRGRSMRQFLRQLRSLGLSGGLPVG